MRHHEDRAMIGSVLGHDLQEGRFAICIAFVCAAEITWIVEVGRWDPDKRVYVREVGKQSDFESILWLEFAEWQGACFPQHT